ncbi:hypothetical protein DPMN_097297 [Dreissena polymorpha]|uniref:Uncharacterized protein n=1 Tax=Dreissena polymorpha TaxID=45954 RepID=A0A9D4LBJ2_DREPO|nr:hypothetical protein DPMN_097297 [Dreissena polymorpha]
MPFNYRKARGILAHAGVEARKPPSLSWDTSQNGLHPLKYTNLEFPVQVPRRRKLLNDWYG